MVLKEGVRVSFLSAWSHLYVFCVVGGKHFLHLCFSILRSPSLWETLSFSPDCRQMRVTIRWVVFLKETSG